MLGDDAFCTQITSKGSRCKAWLAKTTDGVKLCGHHYKIFKASQGGAQRSSSGGQAVGRKRQREDDTESDNKEYDEDEDEDEDEDDDQVHFSSRPGGQGSQSGRAFPKRGCY